MVEAVSIAVHATERTPVSLNDTAVVVGTGMIGLLVLQALRVAGCGKVIAVDLDAGRLQLAKQLGADLTLNPKETNVLEQVLAQTEGRGADIAVEVVGFTPTLQTAIQSVRKGGIVTLVGNLSPTTEFLQQSVVTRELTVYGSCGSCGEYPACLDLIVREDIDVDAMISAVAPLSEGDSWFKRLYDGEAGLMKVILTP
jgi:L-iditol 2-dehydrogenase